MGQKPLLTKLILSMPVKTIPLLKPKNESSTDPLQVFTWPPAADSAPQEPADETFQWDALRVTSEDRCIPRPVSFAWEAVESPSEDLVYDLLISTDSAFRTISVHKSTTEPRCNVLNLHIGTRYFWKVVAKDRGTVVAGSPVWNFTTHPSTPRWLHVPGITNVRDLGGWLLPDNRRIRQGLVYRSSEMNRRVLITEEGKRVLQEELKIRTDLDLRGAGKDDTCWPALDENRVQWVNIPVLPYQDIVADEIRAQYGKVFQIFSDPSNYPIVFHCWGGCDRGGTVAFLLHALLGLDRDSLFQDYELSSLAIWEKRSATSEKFQSLLQALQPFGNGSNDFRTQAENFLLSSGVRAEEISKIREHLTEETG